MKSQPLTEATASFLGRALAEIRAAMRRTMHPATRKTGASWGTRSPLRLFFALALLLALTGCDDNGIVLTFEGVEGQAPPDFEVATLAGVWRSDGHDMAIRHLGFNRYQLIGKDDDNFEFRLAAAGDMLVFDFIQQSDPEFATAPLHFPCKFEVQAPDMVLSCLSRKWIEAQSAWDVPRTVIKNDLVLTGSAPDLLALLKRAAGEREAFHEVWRLHRPRLEQIAAWRDAAVNDAAAAQESLAMAYISGYDIDADPGKAMAWMARAAEQGRASAQQHMGEACREGYGPVAKDPERALAWFRAAAAQDYPPAVFSVGLAYEKGEGVLADEIEAAQWYRRAAALGHAEAFYRLGYLYEQGTAMPRSHAEAIANYQRAVEADAALADAWQALGRLYAEAGDPALRNLNQALGAARRAVELDGHNADYLTTLARVYAIRGQYDQAVRTIRDAIAITKTEEREDALAQYLVYASPAGR
jgi:TPR repeat protein